MQEKAPTPILPSAIWTEELTRIDLLPDIADSGLGHIIVGIITGINEKDWNIHLSCKVFIPFGELVADIIGQEQEIRLHHFSSVGQRNAAFSV